MYLDYFRMRELPFTLTPNPHFFVELEAHFNCFNAALQALEQKNAFIKITGEAGTGKTLVCRKLVDALQDRFVCVLVTNPFLSLEGLLVELSEALGLRTDPEPGSYLVLNQLEKHLQQLKKAGKEVIFLLDEAQALPEGSVDALRLVSDLEYGSEKLLRIVLLGQRELADLLSRKKGRQVAKRITLSVNLSRLSFDEINSYINLRVIKSGYEGVRLFTADAIKLIAEVSDGIPKQINVLCHKALSQAFSAGDSQVRESHVHAAAEDFPDQNIALSPAGESSHWGQLLGSTVLVVVFTLGFLYLML